MLLSFQMAASLILIYMFIFWMRTKKLQIARYNVFPYLAAFAIVSTLVDAVSMQLFVYFPGSIAATIVSKLFIFCFVMTGFVTYLYIANISVDGLNLIALVKRSWVYLLLMVIITAFFKVEFTYDDGTFQIGRYSYLIAAVSVVYYVIISLKLVKKHAVTIDFFKVLCVAVTIALWLVGSVTQMITSIPGLISLADALVVMIWLVVVENPINYTNKQKDCFKGEYLIPYANARLQNGKPSYILGIMVRKKTHKADKNNLREAVTDRFLYYFRKKRNLKVFLTNEDDVIVMGDSPEIAESVMNSFNDIKALVFKDLETDESRIDVFTVLFENFFNLKNMDDISKYINAAKIQFKDPEKKDKSIIVDSEFIADVEKEAKTVSMIKEALDEDRVEVFVQPIYSVEKDAFISGEALVRIRNHDGSVLSPFFFVPTAEKTGLIDELDERVLEIVCKMITQPFIKDTPFEFIDVNLSVAQCDKPGCAEKIIKIAKKYRVDPKMINFEITESGVANDMSVLLDNLKKLTDYGFGFSIDDFGNGEANLNYLIDMPASITKLDMLMTRAYFTNNKSKETVCTIVNLCHGLNQKMVIEGVEDKEQLKEMLKINADYIQGYCFYKPLEMDEYIRLLRGNQLDAASKM